MKWTDVYNNNWGQIFRVLCKEYHWKIDYLASLNLTQIGIFLPRDEENKENEVEINPEEGIQITSPEGLKKAMSDLKEKQEA